MLGNPIPIPAFGEAGGAVIINLSKWISVSLYKGRAVAKWPVPWVTLGLVSWTDFSPP
jgi:hypothetical protein